MDKLIFFSIEKQELENIIKDAVTNMLITQKLIVPDESKEEGLIKIEEVSKLLNVTKVTIHKWKSLGLIPFHKLNRRLYFKKSEVLDSLRNINLKKR